jgi:hypothetical protein
MKYSGHRHIAKLFRKIALTDDQSDISTYILNRIDMHCSKYPQAKEILKLKQGRR